MGPRRALPQLLGGFHVDDGDPPPPRKALRIALRLRLCGKYRELAAGGGLGIAKLLRRLLLKTYRQCSASALPVMRTGVAAGRAHSRRTCTPGTQCGGTGGRQPCDIRWLRCSKRRRLHRWRGKPERPGRGGRRRHQGLAVGHRWRGQVDGGPSLSAARRRAAAAPGKIDLDACLVAPRRRARASRDGLRRGSSACGRRPSGGSALARKFGGLHGGSRSAAGRRARRRRRCDSGMADRQQLANRWG
mmetsp:Transcript_104912/g.303622  ORF Transcript_104912/g.303622 Transcript_104912/m.303622 type:complete len:246 (-) Transcript_104912:362-1099(-)